MGLSKYKLGTLIKQRREKYDGEEPLPIRGVSKDGFIPPKQDAADLHLYNVFYKNDFVFNPARMELNSIAFNSELPKGICSSLYEIFYVTRTDLLLPEYLNIFVKRDEFARRCWFNAIGSARNYFRVGDLSEFEIELPSIGIQKKYVAIYEGLLANLHSYEKGLDDLKLVCDGYIEDLRMKWPMTGIGSLLKLVDERNSEGKFTSGDLKGISIGKVLMPTKADASNLNLRGYKIVRHNQFAYCSVTSRNGNKISLAYNDGEDCIISSINPVFKVSDEGMLLPRYLMMFLARSEFDRYARFNSWGSARETFDWDVFGAYRIPVAPIEIQKSICLVYETYLKRKRCLEELKTEINSICPILIKGSFEKDA